MAVTPATSPKRAAEASATPDLTKKSAPSLFDSLKVHTTLVGDSAKLKDLCGVQDATTNPSLILQAVTCGDYNDVVDSAIKKAEESSKGKDVPTRIQAMINELILAFGCKIAEIVPGLVSIEVDPDYSFDTERSIERAESIVKMFSEVGVDKNRLLIKLAATWEGIRAAEILEQRGIHCNLTLIFAFAQAVACAEAKVTLISPFVGRITDWYSAKEGGKKYEAPEDPGVLAVQNIYKYYKTHSYETVVMGASFRNMGQVLELCGCDKLTVPPSILREMESKSGDVPRKLTPPTDTKNPPTQKITEAVFRWELNEDQMATEKLSEGIRKFNQDWLKLRTFLEEKFIEK